MNYLIELIIRPARNIYSTKDLGDQAFTFSGQEFKRIDFNNQVSKYNCIFKINFEIFILINK